MPKPSSKLLWTKTNPTARTEPSNGKKETGWLVDERPAREFMNWLLFILDEWIDYFEEVTDGFIGYQSIYDAFVGTGGMATHATLNDALSDVPAGGRILVLDSATINTVQSISKNRVQVEFQPNVIYTKGSAQYGLQIQADYVRIIGGEFLGFSGGSDAAIKVDAGADFCKVSGSHFKTCTSDVEDTSLTAAVYGTTQEV